MALSVTIHPTGFVSAGFARRGQVKPDWDDGATEFDSYYDWTKAVSRGNGDVNFPTTREDRVKRVLMGLSSSANSQKVRAPRGSKGITSYSAHQLRDAVWLLEKKFGTKRLSFLTWTLPPVATEGTVQNWSAFVKLLREKLVYHLKRVGLPAALVGCVEIQEERQQREGGLPLHLHFIFVGRFLDSGWLLGTDLLDKLLFDACANFCPGVVWGDFVSAGNVVGVKHSAVSYLGKYVSKRRSKSNQKEVLGESVKLPSSWSICTLKLKRAVSKLVVKADCYESSFSILRDFAWRSYQVFSVDGWNALGCYGWVDGVSQLCDLEFLSLSASDAKESLRFAVGKVEIES